MFLSVSTCGVVTELDADAGSYVDTVGSEEASGVVVIESGSVVATTGLGIGIDVVIGCVFRLTGAVVKTGSFFSNGAIDGTGDFV